MAVVRLLVEKYGSNMNHQAHDPSFSTNSPLLSIAAVCQWWHAVLALPDLVERGADLEICSNDGQTPLHVALGASYQTDGFFQREAAHALVAAGADVNAVTRTGTSCLSLACTDVEMVQLPLEHGAAADSDTIFPAIDDGQVQVFNFLLSFGVDPNLRRKNLQQTIVGDQHCRDNRTTCWDIAVTECYPLLYAASNPNSWPRPAEEHKRPDKVTSVRLVEALLAHGADPFATYGHELESISRNGGTREGPENDEAKRRKH